MILTSGGGNESADAGADLIQSEVDTGIELEYHHLVTERGPDNAVENSTDIRHSFRPGWSELIRDLNHPDSDRPGRSDRHGAGRCAHAGRLRWRKLRRVCGELLIS